MRNTNKKEKYETKKKPSSNKSYKKDESVAKRPQDTSDPKFGLKNDAQWYISDRSVMDYATALVTKRNLGAPLLLSYTNKFYDGSHPVIAPNRIIAPGMAIVEMLPTFGDSNDPTRGLAAITQQNYRNIRAMASGTTAGLEKADIMSYIIVMDSALIAYHQACRLYGLLNKKLSENNYLPQAVCEAFHLDKDSWMNSAGLSKLYQALLRWRSAITKFVLPTQTMPLMARRELLSKFGFFEEERADDQVYFFNYNRVWTVNIDQYGTENKLTMMTLIPNRGTATIDQYIDTIDTLIARINMVEDLDNLSALLQKAYGQKFIELPVIPIDYEAPLVYNKDVLIQLQNATVLPSDTYCTDMIENIDPTSPMAGFLTYSVRTDPTSGVTINPGGSYNVYRSDKLLTIEQASQFTPEQLVEATRFTCFGHFQSSNGDPTQVMEFTAYGSEVVIGVNYITYTYSDSGVLDGVWELIVNTNTVVPTDTDMLVINWFKYHPLYYGWVNNTVTTPYGNLNQVAVCTEDYLTNLNYLAMRGILSLPSEGIR